MDYIVNNRSGGLMVGDEQKTVTCTTDKSCVFNYTTQQDSQYEYQIARSISSIESTLGPALFFACLFLFVGFAAMLITLWAQGEGRTTRLNSIADKLDSTNGRLSSLEFVNRKAAQTLRRAEKRELTDREDENEEI